jgi:hypothetical protein
MVPVVGCVSRCWNLIRVTLGPSFSHSYHVCCWAYCLDLFLVEVSSSLSRVTSQLTMGMAYILMPTYPQVQPTLSPVFFYLEKKHVLVRAMHGRECGVIWELVDWIMNFDILVASRFVSVLKACHAMITQDCMFKNGCLVSFHSFQLQTVVMYL